MKLYRTTAGVFVEQDFRFYSLPDEWTELFADADLIGYLEGVIDSSEGDSELDAAIEAPIDKRQEVWAAGVTYYRSRSARIEESQDAGGGSFYDRVYNAERPELFYKSAGWRVRPTEGLICVRADASWSVPEPELALCVSAHGRIIGYTIGNDVSSRDIEGENPLYLPQAKVYDGSCALGPAVLVTNEPLPPDTSIELSITRDAGIVFEGSTTLSQMRRSHTDLVDYLYRSMSFPVGCVLLTGTGVVPPDDFTLEPADLVEIRIPPIGTLRNTVA